MLLSGSKITCVPLFELEVSIPFDSLVSSPLENSAHLVDPSRYDCTLKYCDKALVAFVPTPFNPTDF